MRLRPFEQRWASVIGGALIPIDVFGSVRSGVDLGTELRQRVAGAPFLTGVLLHFVLWMVWLSPLWHARRLTTFGSLPREQQEAVLEDLLSHPAYLVRQGMSVLKLFFCMAFLGDLQLLRHLGAYDLGGPPERRPAGLPVLPALPALNDAGPARAAR